MQRQGKQNQPDQRGNSGTKPATQIFPGQHVDDMSAQNGRKQAAYGGNGNASQHQCQLSPVRSQIRKYPLNQFLCDLRTVLLLFFCKIICPTPGSAWPWHLCPSSDGSRRISVAGKKPARRSGRLFVHTGVSVMFPVAFCFFSCTTMAAASKTPSIIIVSPVKIQMLISFIPGFRAMI